MKLLLDTHILLWSLLEPERLSESVSSELQNKENELWISPITVWEIMILERKKRVRLEPDAATWIRRVLDRVPFREAKLNREIAILSCMINLPHQDAADRFLAATAAVFDLTLVTADKRLFESSEYQVLRN